jgi:hypothetical protein
LEVLGNYLRKHAEHIRGPEDFIMGFTHALTFIAYGHPELIEPKPSLYMMM